MNQDSEQYLSPRPKTINEEFEDDEQLQIPNDDASTGSDLKKPHANDIDETLNKNNDGLCGTSINWTECCLITLIIFFGAVSIAIGITFFVVIPRNDIKRLAASRLNNTSTTIAAPTVAPIRNNHTSEEDVVARYSVLRDLLNSDKYIPESLLGMSMPESFDEILVRNEKAYRFLNVWAKSINWMVIADLQGVEYRFEYAAQRLGAIMLYYQTLGHYWHNNSNWLTNSHICTWHGMICRDVVLSNTSSSNPPTDGRPIDQVVVGINLTSNHLVGKLETIPFELFQDSLEQIHISKNELIGSIPSIAMRTLPLLTTLDLSYNQLEGKIPSTLRDSINKVTNSSSTSNSSRLETLFVQGNNFTGDWPAAFCKQSSGFLIDTFTYPTHLKEYKLNCTLLKCPIGCCTMKDNC